MKKKGILEKQLRETISKIWLMGCATKRKVARYKFESLEPHQNKKVYAG